MCRKAVSLCILEVILRAAVLCRVQQGLNEWYSQPSHASRDDPCACKISVRGEQVKATSQDLAQQSPGSAEAVSSQGNACRCKGPPLDDKTLNHKCLMFSRQHGTAESLAIIRAKYLNHLLLFLGPGGGRHLHDNLADHMPVRRLHLWSGCHLQSPRPVNLHRQGRNKPCQTC